MRYIFLILVMLATASISVAQFTLQTGYPNGGTAFPGGLVSGSGSTRSVVAAAYPPAQPAASAAGPFNWKWVYTGAEEDRPQYVILKVVSNAYYAGGSGSADDGIGDPAIPAGPYSATSSGTKYEKIAVASDTINYSVSPSASVTQPPGSGPLSADISTTVTLYPVDLVFVGTTYSDHKHKIVVGQKFKAIVSSGLSSSSDTYSWSTPSGGFPFADYQTSSSFAIFSSFNLPSSTSSQLMCYFGKPEDGVSIDCSYYNATSGFTFALTKTLNVRGPDRTNLRKACGTMQMLPSSSYPTSFSLWGATYGLATSGNIKADTIVDPSFVTPNSGIWGYVPIVSDTVVINGSSVSSGPTMAGFPFVDPTVGTSWTVASMATQRESDSVVGIGPLSASSPYPFTGSLSGSYKLFIYYKPTASSAGPSVFIPIRNFPWIAVGSCSSASWTGPWLSYDSGSGWGTEVAYPNPFPTW